MSRRARNAEIVRRVAAADPVSVSHLRREIGSEELERALSRTIAVADTPTQLVPSGDRLAREFASRSAAHAALPRSRGARLGLGAGLAATIAALVLLAGGVLGGGGHPSFAAAAIEVAEANPRLLVTAPGWKVVRADEFEADSGEMTFSDGSHYFEVHWYPARLYRGYLRDRADVSTPKRGTLLGHESTTIHYGRSEYATMLSPQGSVFVEVRGDIGSHRAYEEILASLRPVGVDTWLAAMPPSVVRPDARAAAVERMLRGIPLPPGFDPAALQGEEIVSDPYQLGAKVTGAVACGWVESWLAATAGGDRATAERAVEAMSTSTRWPVLRRMNPQAWPANIRHFTQELQHGRLNRGASGYEVRPDGTTFAFGPAWAVGLACKGQYRRPVDSVPGAAP
jgi:hypothetical protein